MNKLSEEMANRQQLKAIDYFVVSNQRKDNLENLTKLKKILTIIKNLAESNLSTPSAFVGGNTSCRVLKSILRNI